MAIRGPLTFYKTYAIRKNTISCPYRAAYLHNNCYQRCANNSMHCHLNSSFSTLLQEYLYVYNELFYIVSLYAKSNCILSIRRIVCTLKGLNLNSYIENRVYFVFFISSIFQSLDPIVLVPYNSFQLLDLSALIKDS